MQSGARHRSRMGYPLTLVETSIMLLLASGARREKSHRDGESKVESRATPCLSNWTTFTARTRDSHASKKSRTLRHCCDYVKGTEVLLHFTTHLNDRKPAHRTDGATCLRTFTWSTTHLDLGRNTGLLIQTPVGVSRRLHQRGPSMTHGLALSCGILDHLLGGSHRRSVVATYVVVLAL